ncbi:ubiquitin carboxyl-terminal hydrolase 5 [Selaginella moellendorffii]|uniref:ubiquitin carboxyl-terminal hydrolase 5 n=1 Tax=Selaginella moellendorffii TaxID=88036 RepID=UPI000D1CEEA9|nr:ubiquitin carboxyl-terminal hydrolase 5 [Selaginella moellendorffii]XP_024528222.1 ubiquitin carboxyl-terminal hydrolase 5 [Selaginella moellendorffii]XP_024528223.1 ubiquitin carboxyl-terminal hydrolase 5 [Selaginella moellendorffii]|eukprot:XP_024528221.1 ubiquitin carboxyl-terminal hydrolase 5 [Selaginella moellendorffii]
MLAPQACVENAAQEKGAIKILTEEVQTKEGDTYFLVSAKWWKKWVEYIQEDCADSLEAFYFEPNGSKRPPSIDNSDLLEESTDSLRNTLVEERDYVLLPERVWESLHKWYGGGPVLSRKVISVGSTELCVEVYPLQLKIIVQPSGDHTIVNISSKETVKELYRRVCELLETSEIRLWKYCWRTRQKELLDVSQTLQDAALQMGQEILSEVRVNGKWPDEIFLNGGRGSNFSFGGSRASSTITKHSGSIAYWGGGPQGLVGLQNLGNTCFMNSALQCLVHTPQLTTFFLQDYSKEINRDNMMGTKGELAVAFGELLRKVWSPKSSPYSPRSFKMKLSRFAPQFSGFNQHDSQELLAYLLDGLHEDLNRLKTKPYIEVKDEDGRPDEEVADEYWEAHRARNDSVIVDVFQGQYKSTLVCPVCSKVSVTFDPFMYLSLPLPTNTRTMTVTVISSDGSSPPKAHAVVVPRQGKCRELAKAVGNSCGLSTDEMLQLFQLKSQHLLEDTLGLSTIPDTDQLVAYRLPKLSESAQFVAFIQEQLEEKDRFRVPFIIPIPPEGFRTGEDIKRAFEKLLSQMKTDSEMFDSDMLDRASSDCPFSLWTTDERATKSHLIEFDKPIPSDLYPARINTKYTYVFVEWSDRVSEFYDLSFLDRLPDVCKAATSKKLRQEAVSLYTCLEAFLKEEPLGPHDMWYCPRCKQRQQASKKLDLWRLPEILVVHLKRFSYVRYQNKLETFVNFPIHDLDLTKYLAHRSVPQQHEYELYAVSNHYGGTGGGHYTAFVNLDLDGQWYNFDDSHVTPASEDHLKSPAAYVLFYRRKKNTDNATSNGQLSPIL